MIKYHVQRWTHPLGNIIGIRAYFKVTGLYFDRTIETDSIYYANVHVRALWVEGDIHDVVRVSCVYLYIFPLLESQSHALILKVTDLYFDGTIETGRCKCVCVLWVEGNIHDVVRVLRIPVYFSTACLNPCFDGHIQVTFL